MKLVLIIIVATFFIPLNLACSQQDELQELFKFNAISIESNKDLDLLIRKASTKKMVLLGESTHGTSEYYAMRAEISKQLIKEHNFNFISVEGDWDTCFNINLYVKGLAYQEMTARDVLLLLNRWPKWMWANEEMLDLIEWLREYNQNRSDKEKVGFYGFDVYDQWTSKASLLNYVKSELPEIAEQVTREYNCYGRYKDDISIYIRAIGSGMTSCSTNLLNVVELMKRYAEEEQFKDNIEFFRAKQNAYVVKNSEKHFRKNILGGAASWNARARHMFDTIQRLLAYYGKQSKGIAWAHNTHIGDARATAMIHYGNENIGMLFRENLGLSNVFSIGFGTYQGKVLAARVWEGQLQEFNIPEATENSLEWHLNRVKYERFYLLTENFREHKLMETPLGNRAIGVIYHPENETQNYVPTLFASRYDAFIYIKNTKALTPLHTN